MASRVALSVALALVGLALVGPAMGNDASASSGGDELRAGFGSAPLPAPEGGPLAGYGGLRTRRAHGVLDAPEARALVLDQGDVRLALVTLDLVISRPGLRDRLREHASQRDVDSVLLAATHTHSGPGGYLEGWWAERITAGEERPMQQGNAFDDRPGHLADVVSGRRFHLDHLGAQVRQMRGDCTGTEKRTLDDSKPGERSGGILHVVCLSLTGDWASRHRPSERRIEVSLRDPL